MQVGNPCVKKEQMYTPAKGAKMETASATLTMPMSLATRYEQLAKSTGRTKTFYMIYGTFGNQRTTATPCFGLPAFLLPCLRLFTEAIVTSLAVGVFTACRTPDVSI